MLFPMKISSIKTETLAEIIAILHGHKRGLAIGTNFPSISSGLFRKLKCHP